MKSLLVILCLCVQMVLASETGVKMNYPEKIEKIFNGLNKDTMHLVDEFTLGNLA